jgi:two-component system response regulator HydG
MPLRSRALVVDDDENILSAFEDFLRTEQCAMVSSSGPDGALRVLASTTVNLVIADIAKESEPVLTLCRKLRAIRPRIPVIIITGYPHLVPENDAREAGADYYFLKPLDIGRLREAVKRCLVGRHPYTTT